MKNRYRLHPKHQNRRTTRKESRHLPFGFWLVPLPKSRCSRGEVRTNRIGWSDGVVTFGLSRRKNNNNVPPKKVTAQQPILFHNRPAHSKLDYSLCKPALPRQSLYPSLSSNIVLFDDNVKICSRHDLNGTFPKWWAVMKHIGDDNMSDRKIFK